MKKPSSPRSKSPVRGSSISSFGKRSGKRRSKRSRRRRIITGVRMPAAAGGCRWSSSAPIPRGRSISDTPGGPWWGMCWPTSSRRRATRFTGNTTSTTRATRCSTSAARCSTVIRNSWVGKWPFPRPAIRETISGISPERSCSGTGNCIWTGWRKRSCRSLPTMPPRSFWRASRKIWPSSGWSSTTTSANGNFIRMTAWPSSCSASKKAAISTMRRIPGGSGPPPSATRRTGWSSARTVNPPILPPTSPITRTSLNGASPG